MIHTIGESHAYFGWGNTVIPNWIGPVLCYSVGNEKLDRCDIRTCNMQDGDTIIFCFGETDCRCHVHKHITEITTYQDIIKGIVDRYIDAIKLNIEVCPVKLKNVCIFNVVPPVIKDKVVENPELPYLGTDEDRKKYVLYFNELVKAKCEENNFIYFDVYDKYADENGFLNPELSDDCVHIRDGKYLVEFINNNLI